MFRFVGQLREQALVEDVPVAVEIAMMGQDLVAGDLVRPGGEVRPLDELVPTPPHNQVRLLQRVIGVFPIRQQRQNVAVQRRLTIDQVAYEPFLDVLWLRLPPDRGRRVKKREDRSNLPERPNGCVAQMGPVPFSFLLSYSRSQLLS